MNHHHARNLPWNLTTVTDGLRLIAHARTRSVAERWLLDFACSHTRFPLDEALLLGWQWLQRNGLETLLRHGEAPWMKDPTPGTLEEWAARGCVVDPDAIPLLLPGEDGQSREYHLLYDTVTVDEDTPCTITNPELEPALPETHDHRHFRKVLSEREVTMLAHLRHWDVRLDWIECAEKRPSWIEVDLETYSPERDGTRVLINSTLDDIDIMTLLLRHLVELASARVMFLFLTPGGELSDVVPAIPLERGLAVEIVQRRLRVGNTWADTDTHRYVVEGPGEEPTVIRWPLVYAMAQMMEDLLLGHTGETEEPAEVDLAEELEESEDVTEEDLWDRVDEFMWDTPVDQENAAACWLRDFVVRNPRFSVGEALTFGYQLWQRWGEDLAFDDGLRSRVLDIELRTEEEWESRGRGARAGARPLWTYGSEAVFLSADDVEIMDLSRALEADSQEEPVVDHYVPVDDHPELQSLHGLVSDYELSLLGNVTRHGIILTPTESDVLSPWCDEDGVKHVPVLVSREDSIMYVALTRLVRALTVDRLSVEEDELALLIAAYRLGLEEEPLTDEGADFFLADVAPEGIRWGPVYRAAADLEAILRGTP